MSYRRSTILETVDETRLVFGFRRLLWVPEGLRCSCTKKRAAIGVAIMSTSTFWPRMSE